MKFATKLMISGLYCVLLTLAVQAQDADQVLFTVEDMEVSVSEFEYIYNKNNRENADYSTNSVMEYMDLYTKFKLKVKRARDLQLDTISALKTELAGYRSQLAKSYLNDKEVTDKLVAEAYERMKSDLRLSHILVKVEGDADDQAVARARNRAKEIHERIVNGENFEKLAGELSDDTNSAAKGGDLGYITALLPDGFYNMESAAYGLEVGEISTPVRSMMGFHILKLTDRRVARGQREISHILIRVKDDQSNAQAAEQKVGALLRSLQAGKEFEEMARSISDDNTTARRGGYIGKIQINMYDEDFEEAAFAIEKEGGYSKPILTRLGWHIIKLLKIVRPGSLAQETPKIEARIARDERMQIAKEAMIEAIKSTSGFKEERSVLKNLNEMLASDFLTFQWQVPTLVPKTLISFGDGTKYTNVDFAEFLRANARLRMRAQKSTAPAVVSEQLYEDYVNDMCLTYEEQRLDDKYPEFAALMREYEEGILLFEVTKMKVWDRASQDTAGLRAYHQQHKTDFMWPDRARVLTYKIDSDNPKVVAKCHKLAGKLPVEKAQQKLNKKGMILTYKTERLTADEMEQKEMPWQAGWTSAVANHEDGTSTFKKVVEIEPSHPKRLDEARGYIIADYQDQLEKDWVEELRGMYQVDVNENVLRALIRS